MKHLKLFNDAASYDAWKASEDFITPNVSYIEDGKKVEFEAYRFVMENKAGDIAY
jgi:hypothetical protein